MEPLINALLGVKDGPVYLIVGLIGGFCGELVRFIEQNKKRTRFKLAALLFDLLELFVYTILGGCFALVLDTSPLVSLISSISAPTLYAMTQEPKLVKAMLSAVGKNAAAIASFILRAVIAKASEDMTAKKTKTEPTKDRDHNDNDNEGERE